MLHIVTHPIPVIRYEGHPISADNDPIKTKPISLRRVSVIFTFYLEYRELNHLFKYFHVAIAMVAWHLKNTS